MSSLHSLLRKAKRFDQRFYHVGFSFCLFMLLQPCPLGTYNDGGRSYCLPCPAGQFCLSGHSPKNCTAGHASLEGTSTCQECQPGVLYCVLIEQNMISISGCVSTQRHKRDSNVGFANRDFISLFLKRFGAQGRIEPT